MNKESVDLNAVGGGNLMLFEQTNFQDFKEVEMTREFSMRKCLIASVLLGVMSFGITLTAFATTWPGTWPSCA